MSLATPGKMRELQIKLYRKAKNADDFVILSRGKAAEALSWTRQVVTRMGVTLNETKTSVLAPILDSTD